MRSKVNVATATPRSTKTPPASPVASSKPKKQTPKAAETSSPAANEMENE